MGYEVDFFPVGDEGRSGDAIAFRFGNLYGDRSEQVVVVVDGGFKSTAEDFVKHIRKYYGTNAVDLAISTHPDSDHVAGLEVVLQEMDVGCLWMHKPWEHSAEMSRLMKATGRLTEDLQVLKETLTAAEGLQDYAAAKGIPVIEPFTGVSFSSGQIQVAGPTKDYYESLLPEFGAKAEAGRGGILSAAVKGALDLVAKVAESWGFETLDDSGETTPINNSSAVIMLATDDKYLLLTADAGIPALTHVADVLEIAGICHSDISFIQVPHHGSQRNIGPTILDRLVGPKQGEQERIKTAFVSAAKDGAPKHPSKKVTNAFLRRGAPVHATAGVTKWHHSNDAPQREGWSSSQPLPFYDEVDE